jgi:hypothetical protein
MNKDDNLSSKINALKKSNQKYKKMLDNFIFLYILHSTGIVRNYREGSLCAWSKGERSEHYREVPNMHGNRLKERRTAEGLTITELARLSKISTKVISQTERLLKEPTEVTKRKILNGLNAARKLGEKPYDFNYIFPRTDITDIG